MAASILTVTFNPSIDISAVTEIVTSEHKLRCTDTRRDAGGGAVNVGRMLNRFGADCRALIPAGGVLGLLLRSLLEAEGLATLTCDISSETRESFTVLECSSGREFRFVLSGPQFAAAEWQGCLERVIFTPAAPPRFSRPAQASRIRTIRSAWRARCTSAGLENLSHRKESHD